MRFCCAPTTSRCEVWGLDWGWLADDLIARIASAPDDIAVFAVHDQATGRLVVYPGTDFAGLWGGDHAVRMDATRSHPLTRIDHMPLDGHLFTLFLATTAIAMIAPGPDMLFVLSSGMRGGPRAGLLATAGVATSEAIHITVAAAGLSAFFAAAPVAFDAMRIVGAAYLIYLGVQTIRHRGQGQEQDEPGAASGISGRRAYARGLLTNLLNPKMVTFSIAFLPQFVDPSLGRVWLQFALLGVVFVMIEFLVDGTVGVLASRIGAWLRRRATARRRLDAATGGLLIGLGVRLAVER